MQAKTQHPLYKTWETMRSRCNNPAATSYENYGGKGISVCARWDDFWLFVEDMGPKPSPTHTLDRINPTGNYEPGNTRWADRATQGSNRVPKVRARKPRCKRGHPMVEGNIYHRKDGYDRCRECMLLADKRHRLKKLGLAV